MNEKEREKKKKAGEIMSALGSAPTESDSIPSETEEFADLFKEIEKHTDLKERASQLENDYKAGRINRNLYSQEIYGVLKAAATRKED